MLVHAVSSNKGNVYVATSAEITSDSLGPMGATDGRTVGPGVGLGRDVIFFSDG